MRITESSSGRWDQGGGWQIDPVPAARIGADDRESDALIGAVRDMVVTEDRIIIADQDASIRFFDMQGNLTGSVGGDGSGPGEFRDILFLSRVRGDSLVAYDPALIRASVLGPKGSFGRSFTVPWELPALVLFEATDDVQFTATTLSAERSLPRASGDWGDVEIVLLNPEELTSTTFGRINWVKCNEEFPESCRPERGSLSGNLTSGPDDLYVAPSDLPEVLRFSRSGDLRAIARAPVLDGPGFSRLIVDSLGYIWAKRPHEDKWAIFRPDGVLLGLLEMPEGFSLEHAGEDMIAGVHRDSLGVQAVETRKLIRSGM